MCVIRRKRNTNERRIERGNIRTLAGPNSYESDVLLNMKLNRMERSSDDVAEYFHHRT